MPIVAHYSGLSYEERTAASARLLAENQRLQGVATTAQSRHAQELERLAIHIDQQAKSCRVEQDAAVVCLAAEVKRLELSLEVEMAQYCGMLTARKRKHAIEVSDMQSEIAETQHSLGRVRRQLEAVDAELLSHKSEAAQALEKQRLEGLRQYAESQVAQATIRSSVGEADAAIQELQAVIGARDTELVSRSEEIAALHASLALQRVEIETLKVQRAQIEEEKAKEAAHAERALAQQTELARQLHAQHVLPTARL